MAALRVLALAGPGRHGDAAVAHAAALALAEPVALTVVALAPLARGPRCGTSIMEFNAAVGAAATEELSRARAILGDSADYVLLTQPEPGALADFVSAGRYALVLLPGARGRHAQARRLRGGEAEVRVVGAAPQPASA